jgi:uncharacterized protein (TIGR03067 family)
MPPSTPEAAMRPRLLLFAVTFALGFAPAPFPRSSRSPKELTDLDRMQGAWVIVERRCGRHLMRNEKGEATLRGSRWSFIFAGEVRSTWDVKLDPTATPRALDFVNTGPGTNLSAIYRFEGDKLTVCYTQGRNRPTDFRPENNEWSMILRRGGR